MGRAATATMNFDAIRHNYRLAKKASGNKKAVAIIKANAYGHNAVMAAKALRQDADAFGVACIEEALELREAGIQHPILLLEGFFTEDELPVIAEQDLWTAVHSLDQIKMIARTQLSRPISVWLKMDSGMHRLGVSPDLYEEAYGQLTQLPQVENIVLMTHFACADELDRHETKVQVGLFDYVTRNITAPASLANSAGTLGHPDAHRDWQRPGIMLYGATPFEHAHEWGDQLRAVMTLSSEVIAVHHLNKGDAIGYGGSFVCDKNMKVGTVAMGYADGYPRHAKTGTPVLVNGQRTRILGRVSMDMLCVDLTEIVDGQVGSHVELWGENLLASEVAPWCDTIPYTLFTGITKRVHKAYENIDPQQSTPLQSVG